MGFGVTQTRSGDQSIEQTGDSASLVRDMDQRAILAEILNEVREMKELLQVQLSSITGSS